jgi:hypothetical protein
MAKYIAKVEAIVDGDAGLPRRSELAAGVSDLVDWVGEQGLDPYAGDRMSRRAAAHAETTRRRAQRQLVALKELGRPPAYYKFPRPAGLEGTDGDARWRELLEEMGVMGRANFRAYKAVAEAHDTIEDRHSEGLPFFRIKIKPKHTSPDEGLGHIERAELEYTLDVGPQGFFMKRDRLRVQGIGVHTGGWFGYGAGKLTDKTDYVPQWGREEEFNIETNEKKTKIYGGFAGFGFEFADDGAGKISGPAPAGFDVEGEYNKITAEVSIGAKSDTPWGEIYVGWTFVGLTAETVKAYLTRAPSPLFDHRLPYEFFDSTLYWNALYAEERTNLDLLGWDQRSWDRRGVTPFEEFPAACRASFDKLSPTQQRAAQQLGLQAADWAEWSRAAQSATP